MVFFRKTFLALHYAGNQSYSFLSNIYRCLHSDFQSLKFDLAWYLDPSCFPTPSNNSLTVYGMSEKYLPDFDLDLEIDEDSQKLIHIIVYVSLAIVGLLEVITSVSQIVAGLFGFLCGTSKRPKFDSFKGQPQWRG